MKYELMNKQGVHGNFWVEDGKIVKTEPILSWILGWTMEQLEAWSDDIGMRKLYIKRLGCIE